MRKNFIGRTLFEKLAVGHEEHAVGNLAGKAHLMRHDDHRHAGLRKLLHNLQHLAHHLGVKRARRLVEEHDLGLHGKGADDGDIYCSDDFGDDHVQRFNKGADAVAALVSGKLDCVVIDNEPAKSFVAANEGLKVLDTAYAVEDYAAAFAKGSELTEPFNKALEELIADGTVQKIVDKYISAN